MNDGFPHTPDHIDRQLYYGTMRVWRLGLLDANWASRTSLAQISQLAPIMVFKFLDLENMGVIFRSFQLSCLPVKTWGCCGLFIDITAETGSSFPPYQNLFVYLGVSDNVRQNHLQISLPTVMVSPKSRLWVTSYLHSWDKG